MPCVNIAFLNTKFEHFAKKAFIFFYFRELLLASHIYFWEFLLEHENFSKILKDVSMWPRHCWSMQKIRVQKSRATVPLKPENRIQNQREMPKVHDIGFHILYRNTQRLYRKDRLPRAFYCCRQLAKFRICRTFVCIMHHLDESATR